MKMCCAIGHKWVVRNRPLQRAPMGSQCYGSMVQTMRENRGHYSCGGKDWWEIVQ